MNAYGGPLKTRPPQAPADLVGGRESSRSCSNSAISWKYLPWDKSIPAANALARSAGCRSMVPLDGHMFMLARTDRKGFGILLGWGTAAEDERQARRIRLDGGQEVRNGGRS
jgi:hypothetical protein